MQEVCQFWFGTQAQHSIHWLGTSQIIIHLVNFR